MPAPHVGLQLGTTGQAGTVSSPHESPTAIDLHRELNALKKTDVPWMYSVSKCAPQEALWNLDSAFQNFFRRCALKKQGTWTGKLGYPQFKSKKKGFRN